MKNYALKTPFRHKEKEQWRKKERAKAHPGRILFPTFDATVIKIRTLVTLLRLCCRKADTTEKNGTVSFFFLGEERRGEIMYDIFQASYITKAYNKYIAIVF